VIKKQKCLVVSSPYSWGGGIKTMVDEGLNLLKILNYEINLINPLYSRKTRRFNSEIKEISTTQLIDFDKFPLFHHIIFGFKRRYLQEEKYGVALGIVATSHTALPLALSRRPFCIWVATSYADELEAKFSSSSGDEPAKRLRNSIQWLFLEKIERYVLRKAVSVLALSDHTASKLLELEPDIKTRLNVFPLPIDTKLFSPKKSIKKIKGLLINIGRINDPRKNTSLLIKAFSKIKNIHPQARLLLIGEKMNIELSCLVRSLKLEDSIKIIDNMPRKKLIKYLRRAEIFIATPVQEGLGISILEAMSCGLPVIVTRCGGPETAIRMGGGIVTKNNEEDFSKAVIRLLSNSQTRKKMGTEGRKNILNNYSFTSRVKELATELEKQYDR